MIEGRPFIFDLSKDRAPPAYVAKNNPDEAKIEKTQAAQDNYNKILTSLLSPENGFAEWRGLVQKFPNSIPVLQFTDPIAQTNQILRQAALLSRDGHSYLSIRITEETNTGIIPVIGQIISILDSASQLLLIIDFIYLMCNRDLNTFDDVEIDEVNLTFCNSSKLIFSMIDVLIF